MHNILINCRKKRKKKRKEGRKEKQKLLDWKPSHLLILAITFDP